MIFKKILFFVFVVILGFSSFAQDPEFSQFYRTPTYLNPAFTGTAICPRISFVHRNQWSGMPGNFVTSAFSYDQQIQKWSSGLGFLFLTDNAGMGILKTNRFSGMYSFQLKLNRSTTISFGAEATFFQKSLDWDKLSFSDQIHSRRGFIYETNESKKYGNVSGLDFSFGVVGYGENWFVGFATHHINTPNQSLVKGESKLQMKLTAHGGFIIPIGGSRFQEADASISPNILYRQQGTFKQLNLGAFFKKNIFTFGAWLRNTFANSDAFILSLGLETGGIKIGYSYDVTISSLSIASTKGSQELTLGIKIPCSPPKRRFKTFSCPSF